MLGCGAEGIGFRAWGLKGRTAEMIGETLTGPESTK